LPVNETAELIENMAEAQAVDMLEEMPVELAADVTEELGPDVSGDLYVSWMRTVVRLF
jgi:Mg/Co/Ni transporter MgtE